MKYAIIIPDGAADEPLKELGGKTPIEGRRPHRTWIASPAKAQGLVRTVPDGFESGSDVATMCLLGYDPANITPAARRLKRRRSAFRCRPTDWVFRCNLVTVSTAS
jgi:2,3-bisphosphoglycerate-independent phosphoglycerate mutase